MQTVFIGLGPLSSSSACAIMIAVPYSMRRRRLLLLLLWLRWRIRADRWARLWRPAAQALSGLA